MLLPRNRSRRTDFVRIQTIRSRVHRSFAVIACVVISVLAPLQALGADVSATPVARILGFEGTVKIVRGDATLRASKGMDIYQQDEIETGSTSRATIIFHDRSLFNIKQQTTFRLSSYLLERSGQDPREKQGASGGGSTVLRLVGELIRGAATAEIKNDGKAKEASITSGSYVLGIRGTKFAVSLKDAVTELTVSDGKVTLGLESGGPPPVTVNAGMLASGRQSRAPSAPAKASAARLSELQADLSYRSPGSLPDDQTAASLPRPVLRLPQDPGPLLSLQEPPPAGDTPEVRSVGRGLRHRVSAHLFGARVEDELFRGGEVSYRPTLAKGTIGAYLALGGGGLTWGEARTGLGSYALGFVGGVGGLTAEIDLGQGVWFALGERFVRGTFSLGYEVGPSAILLGIERYRAVETQFSALRFGMRREL